MNENSDLLPNLLHEEFEMQMRGYSRRQVDDFVARRNNEIRELEQRLARALDDSEQTQRELAAVRQQALAGRPAHEEVSERIAQILKLADDEARAQKNKSEDDIARQRADAQQESERVRAEARDQAEQMLTAAQEQAERTISAARTEAEQTRTAARADADRLTNETRKQSDAALAQAKAQARKILDEATARASAIHDGAERRLNLLSTRHAETVRRLSDILDGVQGLVAAEAARMSLEEEVDQTASRAASRSADLMEADDGTATGDDLDLALLAPPAPETVSVATTAPPRGDDSRPTGPGGPGGRPGAPTTPEPSFLDHAGEPAAVGGGMTPSGPGRGQSGRPVPPAAPAQQAERPARPGPGQRGGMPRSAMPSPDDDPAPLGLGDLFAEREAKRERPGRTGLIDPDEPTEGIRLLP